MSNITVKQTCKTILLQPNRCQFVTYKVEKTDKENYSLEKIYQKMAPNKKFSLEIPTYKNVNLTFIFQNITRPVTRQ